MAKDALPALCRVPPLSHLVSPGLAGGCRRPVACQALPDAEPGGSQRSSTGCTLRHMGLEPRAGWLRRVSVSTGGIISLLGEIFTKT